MGIQGSHHHSVLPDIRTGAPTWEYIATVALLRATSPLCTARHKDRGSYMEIQGPHHHSALPDVRTGAPTWKYIATVALLRDISPLCTARHKDRGSYMGIHSNSCFTEGHIATLHCQT